MYKLTVTVVQNYRIKFYHHQCITKSQCVLTRMGLSLTSINQKYATTHKKVAISPKLDCGYCQNTSTINSSIPVVLSLIKNELDARIQRIGLLWLAGV